MQPGTKYWLPSADVCMEDVVKDSDSDRKRDVFGGGRIRVLLITFSRYINRIYNNCQGYLVVFFFYYICFMVFAERFYGEWN